MRLLKTGVCALGFALSFSASAMAYDYPVVGEYNNNYQQVFDSIKAGRCSDMDTQLKALSDSEGISGDIYKAICYFENNGKDSGYATLDSMIIDQQYDEVIYVCSNLDKSGKGDSRTAKYQGLAYYNIGDMKSAAEKLEAYLATNRDDNTSYVLADAYMTMKDYDKADAVLDKTSARDGKYYYRKGLVSLKRGNTVSALGYLRSVKSDDPAYPDASFVIADICAGDGRYLCVGDTLDKFKTGTYADAAKEKQAKVDKQKKPFSVFLSLAEEYDNNVTSIDQDQLNGVSEQASFRTAAAADLKYNMYPSYADKMSFGLLNYKSWNYSESDYNVEMHKVYFQMKKGYDTFDVLLPKISAGLTYLGGEKYTEDFSIESAVTFKADKMTVNVPLKIEKKNYFSDVYDPRENRDGYVYSLSAELNRFLSSDLVAKASAGIEAASTEGSEKDYREYLAGVGATYRLTSAASLEAALDYGYYDYQHSILNRNDDYYSAGVTGMYRLTDEVFFTGSVTWTRSDSNVDEYDYSKTVFGTSVGYSF